MLIENDKLTFLFNVEPRPKERARVAFRHGRTIAYTPSKTRSFESQIKAMAKEQHHSEPLSNALSVDFIFYMRRPKTVKRILHTVKPDLSNLLKAVEDACNGVIWEDDSQIINLSASKRYSDEPKIQMIVTVLSE